MSDAESTISSRENGVGKHIIISQFVPSDLSVDDLYRFGLVSLISQGYGFTGTEEELLEQTRNEYGDDDKRTLIFLAFDGRIACGSLVYKQIDNEEESGTRFWSQLAKEASDVARKMRESNLSAQDTLGFVIDKNHQGQNNVSTLLVGHALATLRPGIVLGETKTPKAVLARGSWQNYRTFFGNDEVTKGNVRVAANEHKGVLAAYYARTQDTPDSFEVIYTEIRTLSPYIPDVKDFPEHIQRGFQPIINAQRAAGNTKTAIKPLISIRADLLPNQ